MALCVLLGACESSSPSGTAPPQNVAPVAVDDAAMTVEDTPVTFDPRTNDTDPDGDALTITQIGSPSNGIATVNGGTGITYTPDPDFNGSDVLSYTVSDGNGGSAVGSITVTVEAVNDDPEAVDDDVATDEDLPVTLDPRLNDLDRDGDALTIVAVGDPEHGEARTDDGTTVTYTPDSGFHGIDSFDYTIDDGEGGMSSATVTVTVVPVNSDPLAGDDAVETNEDTPVVFDPRINDSDADGDPLTIISVTDPPNGTAVVQNGVSITYTPDSGFTGTDGFSYTIGDGEGGTATGMVTVTVRVPLEISVTPPEAVVVGAPVEIDADVSGTGPFTFASVGMPLPGGLSLNPATGVISGTPTPAALLDGADPGVWTEIVIRVTTDEGEAETSPFTIKVTGTTLPMPYAYMAMDGSVTDAFGAGGTPGGTVVTGEAGAVGGAVRVAGSESRILYSTSLSSALHGRSGFTYAATIRTSSNASMFFGLSNKETDFSRAYAELTGGRIDFGGRSERRTQEAYRSVVGSTRVDDGAFHNVVGVLDLPAGRIDLYVDGQLDVTDTPGFGRSTFETFAPTNQNMIGHSADIASTSVAPDITHDEVALWDVALDRFQAATVAWLSRRGTSLADWIGLF
jgi:hypothetical protein